MRIPTPPAFYLSQNGQFAASVYGSALTLVDTAAGSSTTEQLPFEGLNLVFSPEATLLAVASIEQVALFQVRPAFKLLATATIPAPLFRMALAENKLLIGAAKFGDSKTTLCLWRGDKLHPGFSGEGHFLGSVAPFQMKLDPANDRLLIAGASGRGAYNGGAKRFVGMVALEEASIAVIWKGQGLPFEPDGVLYPLGQGRLAIYNRDELQLLSLKVSKSESEVEIYKKYNFSNLETVVVSPDGKYIAWLAGTGPDTPSQLQVARLDDGELAGEAKLPGVGYFPSLAVNNTGNVTLCFSEKPNLVRVFSLENQTGRFSEQATIEIESYDAE